MPEDLNIECVSCGKEFVWTAGEQEYYAEKEFSQPKRCRDCREERKRNQENSKGGEVVQTRHTAICDECGEETTVPFKPEKGRGKIYCKKCFRDKKEKPRGR